MTTLGLFRKKTELSEVAMIWRIRKHYSFIIRKIIEVKNINKNIYESGH